MLESLRRGDSKNTQNVCFPEEEHGNINKNNTRSIAFCADQIGVITNFAVITNVVIKRVHCMYTNKYVILLLKRKYEEL